MRNQLFESISINRQQIDWETCSGIAVGVQKYTKTYVSGGGENSFVSSRIETITELSIQLANNNEIQMTLTGEEIRVRDGQRVSVIWGCATTRRRQVIFINHDDNNKLYWIDNPHSFFTGLGIFTYSPLFAFAISIVIVSYIIFVLGLTVPNYFLVLAWSIIILVITVIVRVIQAYRIQSAFKIIKPQILEIVKQLI